jgi:hypothetical protein
MVLVSACGDVAGKATGMRRLGLQVAVAVISTSSMLTQKVRLPAYLGWKIQPS